MDIATILEEYLADLASLPADVAFILDEIKIQDQRLLEIQRRIAQRDGPVQKFVKTQGVLHEYPKEQAVYPRIRSDYQECLLLQQEKTRLATMGLFLVSKHVNTLDKHVAQLEAEGMLAPVVLTPEERLVSPEFIEPIARPRKSGTAERRASRSEPKKEQTPAAAAPPVASTTAASVLPAASAETLSQGASSSASPVHSQQATPEIASLALANENVASGREALEGNGVRLSLKRGTLKSPRRPPVLQENQESFCFCKQGSSGKMIACDSDDCEIEWFHWECVGLTEDPKGSWFCPGCRVKLERAAAQGQ